MAQRHRAGDEVAVQVARGSPRSASPPPTKKCAFLPYNSAIQVRQGLPHRPVGQSAWRPCRCGARQTQLQRRRRRVRSVVDEDSNLRAAPSAVARAVATSDVWRSSNEAIHSPPRRPPAGRRAAATRAASGRLVRRRPSAAPRETGSSSPSPAPARATRRKRCRRSGAASARPLRGRRVDACAAEGFRWEKAGPLRAAVAHDPRRNGSFDAFDDGQPRSATVPLRRPRSTQTRHRPAWPAAPPTLRVAKRMARRAAAASARRATSLAGANGDTPVCNDTHRSRTCTASWLCTVPRPAR